MWTYEDEAAHTAILIEEFGIDPPQSPVLHICVFTYEDAQFRPNVGLSPSQYSPHHCELPLCSSTAPPNPVDPAA
ncbi:hypothetical protein AZE42_11373 [Rhizopogon vesiculosus]|uniref:Uncharacterized protein n=1 Tax=Rhizopogon vesiculosus TaxID=180088 RepID=A0A1J8QE55_9AGAM|nr:hypothetical protein AZE42_11373 [Rhizopogon vesiculosus]